MVWLTRGETYHQQNSRMTQILVDFYLLFISPFGPKFQLHHMSYHCKMGGSKIQQPRHYQNLDADFLLVGRKSTGRIHQVDKPCCAKQVQCEVESLCNLTQLVKLRNLHPIVWPIATSQFSNSSKLFIALCIKGISFDNQCYCASYGKSRGFLIGRNSALISFLRCGRVLVDKLS